MTRVLPPLPAGALAAALAALPTATLLVGERQLILYANERAAQVLRRSAASLIGAALSDLLVSSDGLPLACDDTRHECTAPLAQDQSVEIGYCCQSFDWEGAPHRVITFQDTSALRELQRERDRLIRIATIGQALPSLLHELKNPLAAIAVSTELLLEEATDPFLAEQLHAILSEIRRMKLSFDGIGALERPLNSARQEAIDLACREAGAVMVARARNAGQHLRVHVPDMPLLPLDAGVIRALVLNFVTNSIQASPEGATITLNAFHHEGRFELRVVDTGSGMTPETLSRVTELFFSTKASGSGIGLALCKRVVEGAGGQLSIESVPGFGTSVTVSVPTDNPQSSRRGPSTPRREPGKLT